MVKGKSKKKKSYHKVGLKALDLNSSAEFADTGKLVSSFVTSKEATVSLVPIIIIPLMNKKENEYRVKTLLDSGSMTNWISEELLKHIEYTLKGSEPLEVYTMGNKVIKRFKLVEVYYYNRHGKQSILCYVTNDYSQHIYVHGIIEYIKNKEKLTAEKIKDLVDPATDQYDHKEKGIGLILSNASTGKLVKGKIIRVDSNKIKLEPTIFGTAISGEVPLELRDKKKVVCAFSVPILTKEIDVPYYQEDESYFSIRKDPMLLNLEFLNEQESIGISQKEMHGDDSKAWEHFIQTTKKNKDTSYEVRMPFNSRIEKLEDNIKKEAARTRAEQIQMIRSPDYMKAMLRAHETFIETESVERVNDPTTTTGYTYYMPFRGILKANSTTECRIVMDASSKPKASDVSLNQCLYQGPNLVLNLAHILLRFMRGKYALTADLEKAF